MEKKAQSSDRVIKMDGSVRGYKPTDMSINSRPPKRGRLLPARLTLRMETAGYPRGHRVNLLRHQHTEARDNCHNVAHIARAKGGLQRLAQDARPRLEVATTNVRVQVLAMGIVIVFLSGLIKLWSSNRQMRKVEQLDAERQTRVTQMRKSGLSPNGRCRLGSEIPFGVKALESGAEVDGIWLAKMASRASQPPNRKWSSRRKARLRAPPNSLVEMSDLGNPNGRATLGSRGSRRASKISRREIVEPSHQTREKLVNMPLLEEAEETAGGEQARAAHQGHKGPLGRIQRSLKKMKSLEVWQEHEKKRKAGRVNAREFHENARAKKPQRFYPESSTISDTTIPLVAPRARSHTAQHRLETLLTTHGASRARGAPEERYITEGHSNSSWRAGVSGLDQAKSQHRSVADKAFAAHQTRTHDPGLKLQGSLDSSVTSAEELKKPSAPVRVPGPHETRRSSEDRRTLQEGPVIPARRSSRSSERRLARLSAESRRSEERLDGPSQTVQPLDIAIARYPPNSSRSGPVIQRSQSSSHHPQQQQQTVSIPPNHTSDWHEVWV